MKITYKRLEAAGFTYHDRPEDVPEEMWELNDIKVWHSDTHWLVDALDQGGLEVPFITMEHLNEFFLACKRQPFM